MSNLQLVNGLTDITLESILAASISPFLVGDLFSAPLSLTNGTLQSGTIHSNGTLVAPIGGINGSQLEIWMTVSGGSNQTLNFGSGILIPTDSALSLPKTLTLGKLYILKLWFNGTNWMLVSLVGGY